MLPPAHRRRLPLLDLPRTMLAGFVTRLIFMCAVEHAASPCRNLRALREAGAWRAILRAGVRRHLVNANGDLDLARIAHTCAHPDAAIADMITALENGLTRRTPILPRAACECAVSLTPRAAAQMCDTS